MTVTARRDIAAGEELTADYGLYTTSPEWSMPCRCGSSTCRGTVTGNDWRRKDLKERYQGHLAPAVQELIDTQA